MTYKGSLNAAVFLLFLSKLVEGPAAERCKVLAFVSKQAIKKRQTPQAAHHKLRLERFLKE